MNAKQLKEYLAVKRYAKLHRMIDNGLPFICDRWPVCSAKCPCTLQCVRFNRQSVDDWMLGNEIIIDPSKAMVAEIVAQFEGVL